MAQVSFDYKPGRDVPLGLSLFEGRFQFAVFLPGHAECTLLLFRKGDREVYAQIPMPRLSSGIFSVSVALPRKGTGTKEELFYLYQTENGTVCDPYAGRLCGRELFGREPGQLRAAVQVASRKETQTPYLRHTFEELLLYKLHVRGYTMGDGAGVRKKGTFSGIAQKLPYLKELGINGLLLMPVVEFDELEETHQASEGQIYGRPKRRYAGQSEAERPEPRQKGRVNFWGYTSSNTFYFAPKASYAAVPERADEEFRTLVEQCHAAGIDVYLEMMFDAGCSFSYMLDCLRYWVRCYRVDGFHINDVLLPPEILAEDPYLQQTAFFAAHISDELKKRHPDRFLEYQDRFRDDMRRYLKGDEGMVPALYERFRNHAAPGSLHYITDHNGFTLRDLYSYDVRHNEANGEGGRDGAEYNFSWNCGEEGATRRTKVAALRLKMMKNALAVLLLSAGTPMLLGGDEFGHTKGGNNNSYCQDNEISWLNWNGRKKQKELLTFVKQLIALRKEHPLLTKARLVQETDLLSCGWPEISLHGVTPWQQDPSSYNRLAGILLCGNYLQKPDHHQEDSLYLLFNMHWEPHEFTLPELNETEWIPVLSTGEKTLTVTENRVLLEPRSIAVLKNNAPARRQEGTRRMA